MLACCVNECVTAWCKHGDTVVATATCTKVWLIEMPHVYVLLHNEIRNSFKNLILGGEKKKENNVRVKKMKWMEPYPNDKRSRVQKTRARACGCACSALSMAVLTALNASCDEMTHTYHTHAHVNKRVRDSWKKRGFVCSNAVE